MKLRKDVEEMLANEGVYLCQDPERPNVIVPIVSQDRKLFSMHIDSELDPLKFNDGAQLHGPFWPLKANLLER